MIDIRLIQCSDGNDFCQEFAEALEKGYKVESSGMTSVRVKGQNWTQEQWWAICSRASDASNR